MTVIPSITALNQSRLRYMLKLTDALKSLSHTTHLEASLPFLAPLSKHATATSIDFTARRNSVERRLDHPLHSSEEELFLRTRLVNFNFDRIAGQCIGNKNDLPRG